MCSCWRFPVTLVVVWLICYADWFGFSVMVCFRLLAVVCLLRVCFVIVFDDMIVVVLMWFSCGVCCILNDTC